MLKVEVVAGAIVQNGLVLLAQRGPEDSLANLWEFPGGKVKPGETHQQALVREMQEELAISVAVGSPIAEATIEMLHRRLILTTYWVDSFDGSPQALVHQALIWAPIGDLLKYPMPEADRVVVDWIQANCP